MASRIQRSLVKSKLRSKALKFDTQAHGLKLAKIAR